MGTQTFRYTGGWQTFTVPAEVYSLQFDIVGAGGGGGKSKGGRVRGSLRVTPGTVFAIGVGAQGGNWETTTGLTAAENTDNGRDGAATFGGGGAAGRGRGKPGGWSGGGASVVRIGARTGAIVAVAGGGGGRSGDSGAGGDGGGTQGAGGGRGDGGGKATPKATTPPTGGTQNKGGTRGYSAAGTRFSGNDAPDGILATGGAGGTDTQQDVWGGGGGGGGYRAGGGGSAGRLGVTEATGGAGGSSFVGNLTEPEDERGGGSTGDGYITINYGIPITAANNLRPSPPTDIKINGQDAQDGHVTRSMGAIEISAVLNDPNTFQPAYYEMLVTADPKWESGIMRFISPTVSTGEEVDVPAVVQMNGLSPNTHYYARLWAIDSLGLRSENFNSIDWWMNRSPTAPDLQAPPDNAIFPQDTPIVFTWSPNDPDDDPDPGDQASFRLYWRISGTAVTDPGPWVLETQQPLAQRSWTIPAGQFKSNTFYDWTVSTMDPQGLWGPVAAAVQFYIEGLSTPPIINEPTKDEAVDVSEPVHVAWTFRDPDAGAFQTRADLRYRPVGTTEWFTVAGNPDVTRVDLNTPLTAIDTATTIAALNTALASLGTQYGIVFQFVTANPSGTQAYAAGSSLWTDADIARAKTAARLLGPEIAKYPPQFVQDTALTRINFVKDTLLYNGAGGYFAYSWNNEFWTTVPADLSTGGEPVYNFQRVFHHEFFHVIQGSWTGTDGLNTTLWNLSNPDGFVYGQPWGVNRDGHPTGFIDAYATTSLAEDAAQVHSALMAQPRYNILLNWLAGDPILETKVILHHEFLAKHSAVMGTDAFYAAVNNITNVGAAHEMLLEADLFQPGVNYEIQVRTYDQTLGASSDWSESATFWGVLTPGAAIAEYPLFEPSVLQETLGCGDNRVFIYDRGGRALRGEITPLANVVWNRKRDDISSCTILTNGFGEDCGQLLREVRAWAHELVVFRDGERVWEGPISRVTYDQGDVEIEAKDVMNYVYRRVMRQGYNDSYRILYKDTPQERQLGLRTVTDRAGIIITNALAPDDPNVLPFLTKIMYPDDARQSRVVPDYSRTAWEEVDDLAATAGLDYTTVGRRILVWDTHRAIGRLAELRDENFDSPPVVTQYGMSFASDFAVTNNNGIFGQASHRPLGPEGLVEQLASAYGETEGAPEEVLTSEAQASLQQALQEQADRNIASRWPVPLVVRVSDNSLLMPDTPIHINHLVPGVWVPLRAQGIIFNVAQWQKLDLVTVTQDKNGEKITVTLSPAPNQGADPDAEQAATEDDN